MKKTKLVVFLTMLDERERKDFRKYLESPLFNTQTSLIKVLEVMVHEFVNGKGTAGKEEIYRRIYKKGAYNEASLKSTMSRLLRLLRDFLAFDQFQQDRTAQNQYLLAKLNQGHHPVFFPKYHQAALRDLAQEPLIAADYFEAQRVLAEQKYSFEFAGPQRPSPDLLREAWQHEINSFLTRMMRYNNAAFHQQSMFKEVEVPVWVEMVNQYVAAQLDGLPVIVWVYYMVHQALQAPGDRELFYATYALLRLHQPEFSRIEVGELYTSLLNHAVRGINRGDSDWLATVFDLYKEMLALEFLVIDGGISPWHLKNIVNAGARLGQFDWVEAFIQTWKDRVTGDYQDNAKQFNRGTLSYYRGRYAEAEVNFNRVLDDYKDIFYGINARGYLLQIFFETGNFRGLEALCHSFRMFLDRSPQISERKRRGYIDFINHLRRFIGIQFHDTAKLQQLRADILAKANRGMGSDWLLAKIEGQMGG